MVRICCISDMHSFHRQLVIPECDVLLVAGDLTRNGELSTIDDLCEWMVGLPVKKRIVVQGNHDIELEPRRSQAVAMLNDACTYLEDSGTEIDGLKIWGSPISPYFFGWRWNRHRGNEIDRHWQMIPDDTNILITHSPIHGILDEAPRGYGQIEHVGCADLLRHIERLKQLKLHCAGHIHECHNHIERNGVHYVNASSCNREYKPVNPPIIIDL